MSQNDQIPEEKNKDEVKDDDNNSKQEQLLKATQQQQKIPQNADSQRPFSHPVYKKISATNGRINRMNEKDLVEALEYLSLRSK